MSYLGTPPWPGWEDCIAIQDPTMMEETCFGIKSLRQESDDAMRLFAGQDDNHLPALVEGDDDNQRMTEDGIEIVGRLLTMYALAKQAKDESEAVQNTIKLMLESCHTRSGAKSFKTPFGTSTKIDEKVNDRLAEAQMRAAMDSAPKAVRKWLEKFMTTSTTKAHLTVSVPRPDSVVE